MTLLIYLVWPYMGFCFTYPLCKIIDTGDIKKITLKDLVINLFSILPTIFLIFLIIQVNFFTRIEKPLIWLVHKNI